MACVCVLFRLQYLKINSFWLICALMFWCELSEVFVVKQTQSDSQLIPIHIPHGLGELDRLLRTLGSPSKLTITMVPSLRIVSGLPEIESHTVASVWESPQ